MKRRTFLLGGIAGGLAACSSVETRPVDASGEGTPVYFISSTEADQIMKSAMVEVFPRLPIMRVDAPYQGYTASMNFALDQHSVTLMAVPANGSWEGVVRSGYSFKVSQFGSIPITGSIKAGNLIKAVERMTTNSPKAKASS